MKSPLAKVNIREKYWVMIVKFMIGFWFVLIVVAVRPVIRIYFSPLRSDRVGHFVEDTEILLARLRILEEKSRRKIIQLWIPEATICNLYIYRIWCSKLKVLNYSIITNCILSSAIYFEKLFKFKITLRFESSDSHHPYEYLLESSTKPVFNMEKDIEEVCKQKLRKNGVDIEKKWVCILARDNGYLNTVYPQLDWEFSSSRNSDINTYLEAAEFLASKNFLVFRMGNYVTKPFKSYKSDLVIDYANSNYRCDELDVFLASKCEFFISSSTGLDAIPLVLRIPLVSVNIANLLTMPYFKVKHLIIFKKFRCKGSFLTMKEYYKKGIEEQGFTNDNSLHLRTQDLKRLGIQLIDNTSSEILEVTKEMYQLLEKGDNFLHLNDDQSKFNETFPAEVIQKIGVPRSRIGSKFIEQNQWLLN